MTARYKLNAKIFHNDTLLDAGAELDFDGVPNAAMEPLNDEAKAAIAARDAVRDAKVVALGQGLGEAADAGTVAAIQSLDARLTAMEGKVGVNTHDVEELDVGLSLLTDRFEVVESVINAASKPTTTKTKPKPTETPVEPPVVTEPPAVSDPGAEVTPPADSNAAPTDPATPPA